MLKRNLPPLHPGEILGEEYLKERGLTVTEVAKGLGGSERQPLGYFERASGNKS